MTSDFPAGFRFDPVGSVVYDDGNQRPERAFAGLIRIFFSLCDGARSTPLGRRAADARWRTLITSKAHAWATYTGLILSPIDDVWPTETNSRDVASKSVRCMIT